MRLNLEIGELQAFVAVAEKLSFKAAAESLFISQPALSRRIDKLEACLQTRLLERTTRRVSLTEAGRHFLSHAQEVIEGLEAAVRVIAERSGYRRELVTIACVPSVANHLLPIVLKEFARTYPAVRVRVIDESARDVLDCVVSGQADFGMNFIGTQESDIDFKTIHTERYVLVAPRGHRLAGLDAVPWGMLSGEAMVAVSQSSGNRMLLDHALARAGASLSVQYEINHVTGALALVAAGLGIAVVPELALAGLSDLPPPGVSLVGIPLVEPVVTRSLGVITRKGSRLQPAAQALLGLLEHAVRNR